MPTHTLNLFPINNLPGLNCAFRWYEVTGLPPGETLDTQFSLLTKQLAYQLREPVAPVRRDGRLYVALPAHVEPVHEQHLTPHVAVLVPTGEINELRFDALTSANLPIASAFLNYAIRTPLMRHNDLWGSYRTFFFKRPRNINDQGRRIDILPGFVFSVIVREQGAWLALDLTTKYVDTQFATELAENQDISGLRGRHALYHYGQRWFRVQILGPTGQSIAAQQFIEAATNRSWTVYDYTNANCDPRALALCPLSPDSPALRYRYPGNAQERYGAAALCRLLYPTDDPRVQRLHRQSIIEPQPRFAEIRAIVRRFFMNATLGETPIQVANEPIDTPGRWFPVPDLRFGHNQVLHVRRQRDEAGIDVTELGRTRQRMLLDPNIGMVNTTPFAAQYLLVPQSLDRDIARQFQRDLEATVAQMAPHQYRMQLAVYDDRQARTLLRQWTAIQQAVEQNRINRGYGVVMLPPRMDSQLHHLLKRRLWERLQFQCVTAARVSDFYSLDVQNGQRRVIVRPEVRNRHTTYLRYTACGVLTVNRMWPWALGTPLHYDAYLGIDVLNHEAGCTFIYRNGHDILFDNFRMRQAEKLSRQQAEQIITETVSRHLRERNLQVRSLVIHRDGRSFDSELVGWRRGLQRLRTQGLLASDAQVGVVDIRKTSTLPLRLVDRRNDGHLTNPRIGAYHLLPGMPREGIVCTTGWPFTIPGTAKPLHACIVDGDLDLTRVLEDIFALSQLIFAAPDRCGRLPLTIKLADDFLEPIAAVFDEEQALYEDESDNLDTEDSDDVTAPLSSLML